MMILLGHFSICESQKNHWKLVVWNKYSRVPLLSWEKEYLQAQLPLNTTSHFLIRDLVGHLLEFIKISLAPPMLKIDNFS